MFLPHNGGGHATQRDVQGGRHLPRSVEVGSGGAGRKRDADEGRILVSVVLAEERNESLNVATSVVLHHACGGFVNDNDDD